MSQKIRKDTWHKMGRKVEVNSSKRAGQVKGDMARKQQKSRIKRKKI